MVGQLKKWSTELRYQYRIFSSEKKVVQSFLVWASEHTDEGGGVEVRLLTHKQLWVRRGGTLERTVRGDTRVQFLLTTPVTATESSARGNNVVVLYHSPHWQVLEFTDAATPRLRYGLSPTLRREALALVRSHLESFLGSTKADKSTAVTSLLIDAYPEPATVDVMLWVKGEMRGSIIHTGDTLRAALIKGVELSANDGRFKPPTRGELPDLHIEINILSDLQLPFILEELGGLETLLQTQYGYTVRCGNKQGWYLPGIFNHQRYKNVLELLQGLAFEKTGIGRSEWGRAEFYTFPVEICTESVTSGEACELLGPVVVRREPVHTVEDFVAQVPLMLVWLRRLQHSDGYLPLMANPYTKTVAGTDWTRVAFTAFALAVYGRHTNDPGCLNMALKTAAYIESAYQSLTITSMTEQLLVSTYLGRLAVSVEDIAVAAEKATLVDSILLALPQPPVIALLQVAVLYSELGYGGEEQYRAKADLIIGEVYERWQRACVENVELSLAEYAELLPLLYAETLARDVSLENKVANVRYQSVRDWYVKQQLTSGAFPNTTHSNYTYTRGTGKILEALAVDAHNKAVCLKSAVWLASLQYHEDALFNVPEEFKSKLQGSLMHDEADHTAWIDSVGHVLIAATRMGGGEEKQEAA